MKLSKFRAIGVALALTCFAGLSGNAFAQQQPRPQASSSTAPRPAATRSASAAAAPSRQAASAQQSGANRQATPARGNSGNSNSASQYGNWNTAWGARPSAPPAHWSNKGDWYRHVRACQQKFRSYRAATDTYRTNSGRTVRCTL